MIPLSGSLQQNLANIDRNETKSDLKNTQNLLESLMDALNKIIEEKVKSRLCRTLPPPLQSYLKTIVKIPKFGGGHGTGGRDDASAENLPLPQVKTREAKDEHPEAEQPDFLFEKEGFESPEMKKRNIRNKMKMIRSLLDEYEQMSGKCKIKMHFVSDYLEKNLLILQTLYDKCSEEESKKNEYPQVPSSQQKEVKKKHTAHPKGPKTNNGDGSRRPIDEQLQKIGWEKRKDKLLADSEVEKIVRQSMKKGSMNKRETVQEESNDSHSGSKQYRALVDAVERVRKKQEKEEKLARLFGQKRSVRNENYETIKSSNRETQNLGELNFEEPMVFSMDS